LLAFNDGEAGMKFWDVPKSQATGSALRGAGAQLIGFSPDGKWMATYSDNSEIRIWDAVAGRLMQVIDADGGPTSALQWLPGTTGLVIASAGGRVRIWGTADAVANLGLEPFSSPTPASPDAAAQRSLGLAQLQQVIDIRSFPRLPGAALKWNELGMSSYTTPAPQSDGELFYRYFLGKAGWTAYTRLAASSSEDPDSRTITMLQGGSELTLSVGRPADATDELYVRTNVNVSSKSLPLPADSGWIEFDSSTDLQLVVNTKMDVKQTVGFFDGQMAAEGWLAREASRQFKDDNAWLPYIRGQQDVYLRLAALPGGGTRVVVGDAASSSWQLKKAPAEKNDKPGIEAADYPLPAGATAVKFEVDDKRIDFEVPDTTPPKLGELFVKQMESLEWKRDGAGIVENDYTFITFKKENAEIQLRARPAGKNSTAMIGGDGLLWTKELPTAPVRISYETWLRRGRKLATLDLLDEFVAEMHKIPAKPAGK